MVFLKVFKNKSYFKRFQVKFARRRQGKTDYRARKRLVTQDKDKYNSPRYRLVVRFTNKDIITQIVYSKIAGDMVLCAAYAHELSRYGMSTGLTNYAAGYATGLLLARRLLTQLKLADKYKGVANVTGEDYNVDELDDGPRPFLALLDVGLKRTTTGAKVFSVLKGATDGGLDVPHSDRRFVGFDDEADKLNAEVLKKHIFGGHVADYMKKVQTDDEQKYQTLFSRYVKAGIKPDGLEAAWKKVHAAIKADPVAKKVGYTKPANLKKKKQRLSLASKRGNAAERLRKQTAAFSAANE